ncbi:hypothetical protein GCM10027514_44910 [Azotobacter armeniacus]
MGDFQLTARHDEFANGPGRGASGFLDNIRNHRAFPEAIAVEHGVDKRSGQELQIVQAFSSVEVSERIIRSADIKDLVGGMLSAQEEVGRSAEILEGARQKKGGSLFGNWWRDRDDKLQDARRGMSRGRGRRGRIRPSADRRSRPSSRFVRLQRPPRRAPTGR